VRERERERERGTEGEARRRWRFNWATVLPRAWKRLYGRERVLRGQMHCIFLFYNSSMTGLLGFGSRNCCHFFNRQIHRVHSQVPMLCRSQVSPVLTSINTKLSYG
jgi:hypothetical protein